MISVDLNTGTICGIRVPQLTYWAHPFKPQNRKASFQYSRAYESQDEINSSSLKCLTSWLSNVLPHWNPLVSTATVSVNTIELGVNIQFVIHHFHFAYTKYCDFNR